MVAASLAVLALLAQSLPQSSNPADKAKAQGLLDEGSVLYKTGNYAGALSKFIDAYAAYPSPKLWFNIGQANREMGRPAEALEAFEKFLAGLSDGSVESLESARATVSELQKQLGRLHIECEATGAEVSLDGKIVGLTPLKGWLWTVPGSHTVTASRDHAAALAHVDLAAGGAEIVAIRLEQASAAMPTEARPAEGGAKSVELHADQHARPSATTEGGSGGRRWTWVAVGTTVLTAGGAITFGLLMQSKYDELKKSCGIASATHPGCSQSDLHSLNIRKNTANLLWGATGLAALASVVLFFAEGRAVTVAPMAGDIRGVMALTAF